MKLAIVQYNAGNIQSVLYALERIGYEAVVTDDSAVLQSADKVIFPGVGEASTTMQRLRQRQLDALLPQLQQPFLGICLGMQLMCAHSQEGDTECLGIVPNAVRRFPPGDKVPHMGWNSIHGLRGPLFEGIPDGAYVYFVHSFFAEKNEFTIAESHYIQPFSAGIGHKNFNAVQFHPEKSGDVGAEILKNFLKL